MTTYRAGAWSLIAGALMAMLVFAFHPAHVATAPVAGPLSLSQLVHGVALGAVPLLTMGMWQMGEWLGLDRAAVRLGLVAGVLAMITTVNAATISNFVTPAAARVSMAQMHGPSPASRMPSPHAAASARHHAAMPPLVSLSVAMNRGFAQVHVGFLSVALLLFGFALRRRNLALATTGMLVGAGPLLWQLSGTFSPETTTMPLVVFPQSLWLIAVAATMIRDDAKR